MLTKHKALVLNSIKYGDTSVITHFFTSEEGLISVMCHGVRKTKSNKAALLQPLSLSEIIVFQKHNAGLSTLKEIKNTPPLSKLSINPNFNPVRIFMSVILEQFLKTGQNEIDLFNFSWNYVLEMEQGNVALQHAPAHYLINVLKLVGYLPNPKHGFSSLAADYSHNDELISELIELYSTKSLIFLSNVTIARSDKESLMDYMVNHICNILQNNKVKQVYIQLKELYR